MAVYKQTYRGYSGSLTPDWSRFLVIFRYSRRNLFRSKFLTAFYVICFFWPLLCLFGIYANEHLSAFLPAARQFTGGGALFSVDGYFFLNFVKVQGVFAFILTTFIGPGLVSPDVANGGLTLYLCRPMSRLEYVFGKLSVLAIILSSITWIPGLILFGVQSSLSGWTWMTNHWWIATGTTMSCLLWIFTISLLALALSAWVKWRIAAGGLLLGVLFMGWGFGAAINSALQTRQGSLLNVFSLTGNIWQDLLHDSGSRDLPAAEAWFGLLAFISFCFYLLMKKVRANEVVR